MKIVLKGLLMLAAGAATAIFATTPTTKKFENGAVTYDTNQRLYMEDRHIFNAASKVFGVFDGHGGASAAQYIVDTTEHNGVPKIEALIAQQKISTDCITDRQILRNTLAIIEQNLWDKDAQENPYGYGMWGNEAVMVTGNHWKSCDEFFPEKYSRTGATAIIAQLADNELTVANIGDSRAVLVRDGKIIETTADHKPFLTAERKRIENAGGFVHRKRVWGGNVGFAVSRSLGDIETKKEMKQSKDSADPILSAEPDLYTWNVQAGDILLIATDGLWDVMDKTSGDNAVLQDLIAQHTAYNTYAPEKITSLLTEKAKDLNSRDNITVLAVKL